MRDLQKLWRGVPAVNMSKPVNERRFTLRAILMWTINDFPAYGLFSGQEVHGYKACPLCGPETCAEHARLLGKMIFLGSRRFLPENHRFRRARTSFNQHPEWQCLHEDLLEKKSSNRVHRDPSFLQMEVLKILMRIP